MTSILGQYTLTKNSNENLEILNRVIADVHEGKEIEIIQENESGKKELNEYADKIINKALFGSDDGTINDINKKYGVTHGVFYGIFNFITRGKLQLKTFVNSFVGFESKLRVTQILLVIASFAGVLVKIFVTYPISVGEDRIFLESRKYSETKINRLIFAFRRKRYFRCIKAIFRKNLYQAVWNITIIGGIIKKYSYLMVDFTVAENPEIKGKDAIKIS
ncbi:MAG: hypothetical protein K6D97_03590 [Clostridia bacterium]|nr:hypothetical protein [Clostridia bacterium]